MRTPISTPYDHHHLSPGAGRIGGDGDGEGWRLFVLSTSRSAECIGISKRTAIGFDADLIVLERHPLEDINAVREVLLVANDDKIAVGRSTHSSSRGTIPHAKGNQGALSGCEP